MRHEGSSANAWGVKLSRIEIRGFKSIAKKTTFVLSGGVTCIAGPNGCGKSNIVDAIRWALGEQSPKALRASSMYDVIFSGTQDVPPSSFAGVTLEFVRDGVGFPRTMEGFDSFSITRRLFRTGESEYLINGVRCRLKDITDIFLDTGLGKNRYAIVEQGRIKEIIQARPEDIRSLIDDAAEVGRFRVKRAEALRRLEAASRNLERAGDLLDEVSRQRSELKAQASKARKYQELRSKANEYERLLAAYELSCVKRRKEALEKEAGDLDEAIVRLESLIEETHGRRVSFEREADEAKEKMEGISRELAEARGRLAEVLQKREGLEARLRDMHDARSRLARGVDAARSLLSAMEGEKDALERELGEKSDAMNSLGEEISRVQEEVSRLERDHLEAEKAYGERREELFSAIAQMRSLEEKARDLHERLHETEQRALRTKKDLCRLEQEAHECEEEIAGTKQERTRAQDELTPLKEEKALMERMLKNRGSAVEGLSGRLASLDVELARARARIEMLDRVIAQEPRDTPGAQAASNRVKRVSDIISVRHGFETAVGRALGNALDFVVVHDHKEILSMPHLHEKVPGFVIESPRVDHPEKDHEPPVGDGVRGRLLDHVAAAKGCEDILRALAQDILVVDDIETAFDLWHKGQRPQRYVSMDGMVLEPSGILRTTTEATPYADLLKARAERDLLCRRCEELESERVKTSKELAAARDEYHRLAQVLGECAKKAADLEKKMSSLDERLEAERLRRERMQGQILAVTEDLTTLSEMEQKLRSQLAQCEESLVSMRSRRTGLEASLAALEGSVRSARERRDRKKAEVDAIKDRHHAEQVDLARKKATLEALTETLSARRRAIEDDIRAMEDLERTSCMIEGEINACRAQEEGLKERARTLEALSAEMLPVYERAFHLAGGCRMEEEDLRGQWEAMKKRRSEILLDLRESEVAWSMGTKRMEVRFKTMETETPEDFDEGKTRALLQEIEDRIERMGQINFASLEAFDQVQKRWEDLHRQYEDLVQASERLREVIRNIDRESSRAFNETFARVKEYFREIFTSMFGGGKADLVEKPAGEGEDPGIEILASPPFKRLKTMSLLSEGEKTLCAVSLLFALFRVNPSPFCILDEVDAPLDDANITRLNRLIRSYCAETQFIVVTHNRHTMEMADVLYGVTYETPGISKVVSMSLSTAEV